MTGTTVWLATDKTPDDEETVVVATAKPTEEARIIFELHPDPTVLQPKDEDEGTFTAVWAELMQWPYQVTAQ